MSFRQFREIRLRDFRCFREQQVARLAPLTLLVGENSTGKTSFLAAAQAVWDAAHGSGDPDFRKAPYDLGAFPEIVYRGGGRGSGAESFAIGFKELAPDGPDDRLLDFEVTFESRDAAPAPVAVAWRDGAVSVTYRRARGENARYVFKSPSGSWCYRDTEDEMFGRRLAAGFLALRHLFAANVPIDTFEDLEPSPETRGRKPSPKDYEQFSLLSRQFARFPPREPPFTGAPVHPGPRRTYDPVKLDDDPWGADVPSRFANLQLRDKSEWTALKEKLDAFGRESGLFDDISVKQLTGIEGGPFQLQVRKFGNRGRKGLKRNLMDVGFGVSQVLPVLAALLRANGPAMFLLQQPELHLHPSAQAALGSLFCRTAEAGRQILVETHSDYIMNRIRLDVRDRRTELTHEDVSILYFERNDRDVLIHLIRFDKDGNVLDTPSGYRRFFTDELNRSLDY